MNSLIYNSFPGAAWTEDSFGWSPLAAACANGSESRIIEALMNGCRFALSLPTNCGMTPLYLAVWRMAELRVLEMLLDGSPGSVHWPTKRGETPLTLLWMQVREQLEEDPDDESHDRIELLLRAAHHGITQRILPNNRQWRVVHAAAASLTPPGMFEHLLRKHPEQVAIKDEYGRFPLTFAVSAKVYRRRIDTGSEEGSAENNVSKSSDSIVVQLLRRYPQAASVPDPNGRLPLMLAIESEKKWCEGISDLVKAAPRALYTRDLCSGMYPFMASAMIAKKNTQNVNAMNEVDNSLEESDHLTTIFGLIREGPTILSNICSRNNVRL